MSSRFPFPGLFRGLLLVLLGWSAVVLRADSFYVDPTQGSDYGRGSLDKPYRTLEKALEVVKARVSQGQRSDHIYLRGGVYPHPSTDTAYELTLVGSPKAPAVISAMPAAPGAPGAVQRKSGRWYERVVFDDGWRIRSPWREVAGQPGLWVTEPGFALNEWPANKLKWALPTIPLDETTAGVHLFSLAPFMVVQDGRPTVWVETLDKVRLPGQRWFDFKAGRLYVRPFDGRNPNDVVWESWYGGADKNGHLLRDGEGRALFRGNLSDAVIRGFEFRLLTRTFEFRRRGYAAESERERQQNVVIEDNEWNLCFIHLLLDSNTVLLSGGGGEVGGLNPPAFADRSHWTVRHNRFYRPTKECFQVHGRGHIFEANEIIEHGGPWAGPAARVGAINLRNMPGAIVRGNFIWGQNVTPWDIGSVIMIEARGVSHGDENGENIFGGQTIEDNVFAGMIEGPAIAAGKGGCRMHDITIRRNLFTGNVRGQAILLASPHRNLRIEDNLFYDQTAPIRVLVPGGMRDPDLPSSIRVTGNLFVANRATVDAELLNVAPSSDLHFADNLIFASPDLPAAAADGARRLDPRLNDPAAFDFSLAPDSPLRDSAVRAGPYDDAGEFPALEIWQRLRSQYPAQPFAW